MKISTLIAATGVAFAVSFAPVTAFAKSHAPVYTAKANNVAVGGYDAVSYFTEGTPVKGSGTYSTTYEGAQFEFASQENLDKFKADPARYAPQFGGYCAWAVAHDKTAKGNPQNFTIVDGKLYLNLNDKIQKDWRNHQAEYIAKGNQNWPGVLN